MARIPLTPHERQGILSVILIAAVITLVGIVGKHFNAKKELPTHPQIEVLSTDSLYIESNGKDSTDHKNGSEIGKNDKKNDKKDDKKDDKKNSKNHRPTNTKKNSKPRSSSTTTRSHLDETNISS